ncbi:hypothetical protein F511_05849 [Dorcoceras hygrometricum]|uniref:Reverse transcriptase Ty1/copia-type domain-containing protein n=1 Tax=Dorcoceras hygrometricum TaxID=472368 RepID=A0A2Z7CXJ6_9LAMI|nr:hypothetical protein F511_05849 [Dorcoceras hygrometricum]
MDLPPENKPLGCKWIFKRKMKSDGTIDKYKARLVIKGYRQREGLDYFDTYSPVTRITSIRVILAIARQREGLDYFDTYSPVTRITSIRVILAIAALRNHSIHQMDVKTAFLNGDLEEEIYMEQPEGFSAQGL